MNTEETDADSGPLNPRAGAEPCPWNLFQQFRASKAPTA
jgi:hypothetical protein